MRGRKDFERAPVAGSDLDGTRSAWEDLRVREMKRRSMVILILIVVALAVIPSAGHSFVSHGDAPGGRLKAGIWSVFLRYHA